MCMGSNGIGSLSDGCETEIRKARVTVIAYEDVGLS